eukprot:COSAG02_NODE_47342_length_342_cov_0.514403_1_plen_35_part_10
MLTHGGGAGPTRKYEAPRGLLAFFVSSLSGAHARR